MQRKFFDISKARPAVAAGVLFAALGLAPVTLPAAQSPTAQVRIKDLDLATPRGQRVFEQRLTAAVYQVCVRPNASLPGTREVQQGIHACQARARADAQRQLLAHGIQLPAARSVRRD
jgi:UrcA family protein